MPDHARFDPLPQLVAELKLPERGVAAVLGLLGEGATVPFIARYRKEATGGLDEVQIRNIEERHAYLKELEERRATILASIEEQGKLTDELRARLLACTTKAELEDLYLPFKPRRRTRATIARERGLQPLADRILAQPPAGDPRAEAAAFVDPEQEVPDVDAALAGARDIVAETVSEAAEVRAAVRALYGREAVLHAEAVPEKTREPTKFELYYDHREPAATMPSHRYLAVRRGANEGVLKVDVEVAPEQVEPLVLARTAHEARSPFAAELRAAVADGVRRLLGPGIATDLKGDLKERADRAAVEVFARNLEDILLAAPLGQRPVVAIDPGLRTGCKCVALAETGKFLETTVIYLSQGAEAEARGRAVLLALLRKHQPAAVAVGNGTGGRETEDFVRRLVKDEGLQAVPVSVNESGASVYSASDLAREEFPDLDVTVRGAISIGRRLQDPLAELVKIDPQSIGVGQYQHDVHQPLLARKLDEVVESCVNRVGVEANTASAALLGRVAGIGPALAKKIVKHRDEHGPFADRAALRKVPGLGPKTFEQAAGFLRIRGGRDPLDASAVHPERYALVASVARDQGVPVADLVGNASLVDRIPWPRYVSGDVGEPTLRDIAEELKKPGRDPRKQFEPPRFRDDVRTLEDLKPGMELEGVVTNVTAFGAFVDVGVHQDGLVHKSQLAERFVKDPHEVVRTGDRLQVRVLEVDLPRRRIALTARRGEAPAPPRPREAAPRERGPAPRPAPEKRGFSNNPFADLLKKK
jgi:protein Tex